MSLSITHNGELARINPEQRNRIEISKDRGMVWL